MFNLPNYKTETVHGLRGFHYYELQTKAEKFNCYSDLENWCKANEKNMNQFRTDELVMKPFEGKFKIDDISKSIMPSYVNEEEDIVPVLCLGDGNCLYNSISLILTGDYQLSRELRLKVVNELILNREYYDTKNLNIYSSAQYDGYETEVLHAVKNGVYSSMRNMVALSNVLGCEIRSIYPDTNNPCVNKDEMNKMLVPRTKKFDHILNIMWTHTTNTSLMDGWSPNHFVPCVESSRIKKSKEKKEKRKKKFKGHSKDIEINVFVKKEEIKSETKPEKKLTGKRKIGDFFKHKKTPLQQSEQRAQSPKKVKKDDMCAKQSQQRAQSPKKVKKDDMCAKNNHSKGHSHQRK